jgi:hypothetical protein
VSARYGAGDAYAAVAAGGVVLLEAEATDRLAAGVWQALRADAGVAGIVEVLAAGGPLSALPPFVIALREGEGWRIAVRGERGAIARTGAGDVVVSGAGASTWAERGVPEAASIVIGGAAEAAMLPVVDGVVRAGVVVAGGAPVDGAPVDADAAPAAGAVLPAEPVQPHTLAEVHDVPEAVAASDGGADADDTVVSLPTPRDAEPVQPASAAEVHEVASPESAASGITDSIPEHLRPGAPSRSPAAQVAPPPPPPPPPADAPAVPAPDAPAVDDDIESTVIAPRKRSSPPSPVVGDHDGETLSIAEARALQGLPPAPPPPPPPPPPRVRARVRLSTGQVLALDRPVIVGRRPRSARATGADLPQLIAVPSPQQDISRNHVQIHVEGDSVLATDLETTNGTTLLRPGAAPVRLHPREATVIVGGDVLDLGEGVTVALEED